MEAVVTDALKAFWEDVLYHPADKPKRGQGGVLDLACLVVAVPIADRIAVVVLDAFDGDGWRDDVLGEVGGEALSAGGYLALVHKGDEAFWILPPSAVDVLFDIGIGDDFTQHRQEVKLPLSMKDLEGDI